MVNILDKLEEEAQKYMHKRLSIEESIRKDIENEINQTKIDIQNYLNSLPYVNLNYLSSIIDDEIRLIVNRHLANEVDILNNAIENTFESGGKQAERFITLTKEDSEPILSDESKKKELLLILLLFGRKLFESFNGDILSQVQKDLYSVYIISKKNGNGINTQLSGTVLSQYLDASFVKFQGRANTMVITETNRALNQAIMLRYVSAKIEIPKMKVKWVEVKDSRLCKYCREAANGGEDGDGVYNIGNVEPPPLHPNCRCILIPFLYKWFT